VGAIAKARKEFKPEIVEQRVHGGLVRGDPLAAELVGLAADLGVPDPAADPVTRLEHDHVDAPVGEARRGDEPGDASADHRDLGLDAALRHP
jgi:hypothetical protein